MIERADDNGCCCHAVHEDIPADEHGPFIAGEPRTADCCAVKRAAMRESLAACQRELAIATQPTFHPRCQTCGGDAPVDHAFATLGAPGGFLCVRCGSQALKLRAEAAEAERDELRKAARLLVAYRDRVGPLSFQLEKADHFIDQARAILSLSPHETP